jgi:hypothetical protein
MNGRSPKATLLNRFVDPGTLRQALKVLTMGYSVNYIIISRCRSDLLWGDETPEALSIDPAAR